MNTVKQVTPDLILDVWPPLANRRYFDEHIRPKIKVGDFAECSECHRNEMVKKLYGGKPVCADCVPRVYA